MRKTRQILCTSLFSSKKYEKKFPIINNHGEHTSTIEGRISLLQLFSCNHKAHGINMHYILVLFIYSNSMHAMWKEYVSNYDKNSYSLNNMDTGYTVCRNVLEYYAIIDYDATSFSYIYGTISPSKEVFKYWAV